MKHVKLLESWQESSLNEGIQQEIEETLNGHTDALDAIKRLQGLENKYNYELSSKDQELINQAYNPFINKIKERELEKFEKRGEYVEMLKRYKAGKTKINTVLYLLGVDKEHID